MNCRFTLTETKVELEDARLLAEPLSFSRHGFTFAHFPTRLEGFSDQPGHQPFLVRYLPLLLPFSLSYHTLQADDDKAVYEAELHSLLAVHLPGLAETFAFDHTVRTERAGAGRNSPAYHVHCDYQANLPTAAAPETDNLIPCHILIVILLYGCCEQRARPAARWPVWRPCWGRSGPRPGSGTAQALLTSGDR